MSFSQVFKSYHNKVKNHSTFGKRAFRRVKQNIFLSKYLVGKVYEPCLVDLLSSLEFGKDFVTSLESSDRLSSSENHVSGCSHTLKICIFPSSLFFPLITVRLFFSSVLE